MLAVCSTRIIDVYAHLGIRETRISFMTFQIVNNLSKTDTILNYVGTMRPIKSCGATMASFQYSSVSINDSQFIRRCTKTKRNE